jgi:glycosyltransferase involved in cell wall biosynthesis
MNEESQAHPEPTRPGGVRAVAAGIVAPVVIVAARNEADRIGATLSALADAFPGSELVVANDASTDPTSDVASAHGARVVRSGPASVGKGGNVTAAVRTVLDRPDEPNPPVFLICDADLAGSASELPTLVEAVARGDSDLAIAAFRRRIGGGFGFALRFARWAIEKRSGYRPLAPISGQRAMTPEVLRALLPFARGYGMEVGMTIDAVRAGFAVREIELDLEHRTTGRTPAGFVHRARQLRDFGRAYLARRPAGG